MEILNKEFRKRLIEKGIETKFGHYGSAMSCIDIVVHLYKHILKENDIFIMAKGHGALVIPVVLECLGNKINYGSTNSYNPDLGIEATTASLGHGLPIAIGRALGKKLKGCDGKVYVLVGDGELQEGSNWEALQVLDKLKLDNLIVLIDHNGYQGFDSIKNTIDDNKYKILARLEAFGREVAVADGHNDIDILEYLDTENTVIFSTHKGHGIPYFDNARSHHVLYYHENPKPLDEALECLS